MRFSRSLIILLAAALSAAADESDRPSVSTTGTAEIKVVPDQVEVAVGVMTVHVNLQTAKTSNDQALAAVINAAKKHGIAADQIQTDYVSVEPQYDYEHASVTPVRYTVRRSLVVICKDLDQFEPLLSAVIVAGANQIQSVRFMTSKLREHRDHARKMATQAALEKARLLAESLGRSVGKARNISEASSYWGSSWGRVAGNASFNALSNAGDEPAESDSVLAPGRISVSATVSVTFDLE